MGQTQDMLERLYPSAGLGSARDAPEWAGRGDWWEDPSTRISIRRWTRTVIHSLHSWVQLSLYSGCGTLGCQVKCLPLLCLLWLTANRLTKAKSLWAYCKSLAVMKPFTAMSMRVTNQKIIVHSNFGTLHCTAMCAFRVQWVVPPPKVHRVSSHAYYQFWMSGKWCWISSFHPFH